MSWTSTHAESAEITPGLGVVPVSGSRTVSPAGTTTWRITVRGATGQTATDTATLRVTGPASRACAAGSVIAPGGRCDLKDDGDETVGAFTVAAGGTACLRMERVVLCAPDSHDIEDATLNRRRVTFMASRDEGGNWTISQISISISAE